MAPLEFLADELAAIEKNGLLRRLRDIAGQQAAVLHVEGRPAINFSSNNYLGLATSPSLCDAAARAIHAHGAGAGSARLIAGNLPPHRDLEHRLARFHGTEAALLFTSGYQANLGVLSALAGPDDVIYSDEYNHASIIDGARLSRARIHVYRHLDTGHLSDLLRSTSARRRFLVTESVFSMDGDTAPLRALRNLADEHDAALIVDEAHAIGALGPAGHGLAAQAGATPDVLIATLGKAFGSLGAYVAGSRHVVQYLLNRARSFVFTTALPPSVPAAALAALDISESPQGEELRATLQRRIEHFRQALTTLGLPPHHAGHTAIFPVHVGDDRQVMQASNRLLELGIYCQGIRPPTVPPGTARLRFSLMATHTKDHIDQGVHALATLCREHLLERSA